MSTQREGLRDNQQVFVCLVTAPAGSGREIAKKIVDKHLCACVNVLPGITSFYFWEGSLCEDEEELLVIKTTKNRLNELFDEIKKVHPYTVPEYLVLPVVSGFGAYLDWVKESVK